MRPYLLGIFMACAASAALADVSPTPETFSTKAELTVGDNTLSMTTAVATLEPRKNAPGYSWLRVHFYFYKPTTGDISGIQRGSVESMDKKWKEMKSSKSEGYSTSHAELKLSVDKDFNVRQVDMSVPGHACSIARYREDVQGFLQSFNFDGKHLKLKSRGKFVCDMSFIKRPDETYRWDINLDTPVFSRETSD